MATVNFIETHQALVDGVTEGDEGKVLATVDAIIAEKDAEIARLKAIIGPKGIIALAEQHAEIVGLKAGVELAKTTIGLMAAESASRLAEQHQRIKATILNEYGDREVIKISLALDAVDAACEVNDGN